MLSLRLLSGINQWKPNTACRYNAHENSAAHVQSLCTERRGMFCPWEQRALFAAGAGTSKLECFEDRSK